jgi:hypothetical protein
MYDSSPATAFPGKSKLLGFQVLGKSPELWDELPSAFTNLRPIRFYGDLLNKLVRMKGDRARARISRRRQVVAAIVAGALRRAGTFGQTQAGLETSLCRGLPAFGSHPSYGAKGIEFRSPGRRWARSFLNKNLAACSCPDLRPTQKSYTKVCDSVTCISGSGP